MGTQTAVWPRTATHFITAGDFDPDEVGDGGYDVRDVLRQREKSLRHIKHFFCLFCLLLSQWSLTSAAAGFRVMAMETRPGPFWGVPNDEPNNMDEGSVLISLSLVSEPKDNKRACEKPVLVSVRF